MKSYLYKAAKNGALLQCEHMAVRMRHSETVHASGREMDSSSPQQELEYKELQLLIERTLCKLPERRSKIFTLHRDEGKKYQEIAELLSLSIKTVEAEMTKALRALRSEIEQYN